MDDKHTGRKTAVKQQKPPERREMEWADRIPDGEEDRRGSCEETYRDGSLKNECWNGGDYERKH